MIVRFRLRRLGICVILTGIVILVAFPFYWMVASSLKSSVELTALPPIWVPRHVVWSAYQRIFQVIPFGRAMFNSFVVSTVSTLGILTTSTLAGYTFAKFTFRGKHLIFMAVLATMMIPSFVTIVPLYYMMNSLNLVNTFGGLILPNLASGFGIFLMRQFASGISNELIEAARMDGASEWQILVHVVVPLLKPAIAALGVFAFVFQWNRFLWPLTIVHSSNMDTVTLALNGLRSFTTSVSFTNVVMAGAAIGMIPSIIIFFWLQRFLVQGIAMTGIKG